MKGKPDKSREVLSYATFAFQCGRKSALVVLWLGAIEKRNGTVLTLMTQSNFVEVGPQGRPDHGKATVITVDGVKVALFNVDGRIYALSDFCVRCGTSLALGTVAGTHVSCRECSWRYDIISGRLIELPALATDRFEVKVNDGHVLVSTEPSALSR